MVAALLALVVVALLELVWVVLLGLVLMRLVDSVEVRRRSVHFAVVVWVVLPLVIEVDGQYVDLLLIEVVVLSSELQVVVQSMTVLVVVVFLRRCQPFEHTNRKVVLLFRMEVVGA